MLKNWNLSKRLNAKMRVNSNVGKLGDTLRESRIARGLTIDQAEQATKIRGRLIRALEDGDYTRLPNPGYVRGYISSYARLLELDSMPLLNLYKAETGAGRFHEISLPATDEAVSRRGQQHALPARGAFIVALVIAVLSLSVWATTRIWRGPEAPLPEPSSLVSTSVTSESASAIAKPVEQPPLKMQPFTLKVEVSQDGASWLKITVDGKKAYEGTLTGGQSKTYEVSTGATVLVGKPSAVSIKRDGTEVKILASGSTPSVSIDAEPVE